MPGVTTSTATSDQKIEGLTPERTQEDRRSDPRARSARTERPPDLRTPFPQPTPRHHVRQCMTSHRLVARAAGVFYALNIVTIVTSIALRHFTTAHLVLEVGSTACSVVVAALLYELLKPVNEAISLVAAFFRLTACAVALIGYVFKPAANMVIVFFGFHFLAIGYLVFRAGYRLLGGWAMFGGGCALIFIVPSAAPLFRYFVPAGAITELSLTAWLLAARLDGPPWRLSNAVA